MPGTVQVYAHITKDPEVCGGKACIDGTRIRVMDIVGLHRNGYTPENMLNVYSAPLALAQIYAALTYYYDHPEEIEASLEEDQEMAAKLKRLDTNP
ncbi:MAG TPA: DUF433 domain-containing protein [Vicinamibacteria bacterium]|nr:DUF433 domain-containing protein [Vicinamibacteria bacterium]